MRHKTTQGVWDYFNLVRNGESAPLRADIDPQALKSVLPDIFILEMSQTGGFTFRLAGSRVCATLGQEARNTDLLSYFVSAQRHKMKLAAESVLANRTPLLLDVNGITSDEPPAYFEMLLLPLRSRETICDRLLGCIAALQPLPLAEDQGYWLEAERMTFLRGERQAATPVALTNLTLGYPAPAPLMRRIMHLTLLQGGRKD